ncbi:hypothetical protein ACQE3E_06730 [Methylomonas sp. MED-D]|uniref:hypothetical protein n=1 Tax=Methylomonas sp. MED-D TaxID=3418768 RepID=UPI003D06C025
MNTESMIVKYQFNQDTDIERLAKIIEKKGGNIWDKKGRRAYFSEDHHYVVSRSVVAQPYDAYIDIESKELVFTVNADDFSKKYNSVEEYKQAFINSLRS